MFIKFKRFPYRGRRSGQSTNAYSTSLKSSPHVIGLSPEQTAKLILVLKMRSRYDVHSLSGDQHAHHHPVYRPTQHPFKAPLADSQMPEHFQYGHSTNLIGLPTSYIASQGFNDHPKPLHIAGTRESAPGLFEKLAQQTRREACDQI